jgi:predicted Zn-dependent peptidase
MVVGVPGLRRDHPDAWVMSVLNAVLGDGMSSRLFLSLREERGLAYDISSGLVDYADAGAFEISAGVDPERLPAALEAVLAELVRVRDEPVPCDELDKAKAYLSGGLELRMDETRHLASWIGGQEALHDRVLTLEEALAAVAAVDAADLRRLAEQLFRDEGLRLAVVAPARHVRGLERRLRLPA